MPHRESVYELRKLLTSGEISPLEVVDAHLAQIDRVNPGVNAFVRVFAEEAREAARTVDVNLPLGGIPITIKDSFDVAGQPTLCGSRFRAGHRAASDATSVRRLREAGAILLGKTNCPEFLANYETDNHITGRTNNPWNLDRTCGGSSGGEAAAIASFCSTGGIGSDGGGSVRLPAHFCGICGLKPTPGRVSATGHFPLINHPGGLLGVAGPMARSINDLRALFLILAEYDPADPFAAPVDITAMRTKSKRVGVMESFGDVPCQASATRAVRRAAELLRMLHFEVDEFRPRGLERAPNVWSFFFSELATPFTRDLLQGRESEAHWTGTEFYDKLKDRPEPTGRQVVENLAIRDRLRASLIEQIRDYAVLLSPVASVNAFPHRARRYATETKDIGLFQAMMPLTWVNLLGFPAITLPITLDEEGLPVGVQMIAAPWNEETLFAIAGPLESQRGPFASPPSIP